MDLLTWFLIIVIQLVSATPYDELSGNIEYGTKKNYKVRGGENYRGIQYFKDNNLLKQTFVLNDSTKDKFKKKCVRMDTNSDTI
jgi:hypothetical protein